MNKMLRFLGLLLIVALGAGAADVMPPIRPDHPRMFFNAETWPAIKARAVTDNAAALQDLLKRARGYPAKPVCSGTEAVTEIKTATGTIRANPDTPIPNVREWGAQAAECALAWRFTGERALLEKAKAMLAVSVDAYHEAYRNRRAVNWYSTSRILALSAYDWIYEALTPEERRAIIVPLVEHVEAIQRGPGKPAILRRNSSGVETGFYGVEPLLWYSGLAADGDGFCDELARRHLVKGHALFRQLLAYRNAGAGDDGALSSAVPGYCMGIYPYAHFNFLHTYLSACGKNLAADYPGLALFPNWIYWTWIPNARNPRQPLYSGFGDTPHDLNALETGLLWSHMTQYMFFFRSINPAAARLAASLRERAPNRNLSGPWCLYPFLLSSVDDIRPFPASALEATPCKARHFEKLGQFLMRSGWTTNDTFCTFTAGASLTHHKHHDENNFVIYKHDFLALDSGSRAAQTDYNLRHYYAQTVAHNCILIQKPNEPLPGYWGIRDPGPQGKYNDGGQYGIATPLAFETNDRFTYIASDATKAYGEKARECVRQFIHLQPDFFIVYDRVESAAPYSKKWLLHTQNKPTIDGHLLRADCGSGRLSCETLFPAAARLTLVGGPGREFWSNGKNWPLDANYVRSAQAIAKRNGRGPYFGAWRLEVTAAEMATRNTFLHVLTATDAAGGKPLAARALSTPTQEGAELTLPDGTRVTVLFNKTGAVGGTIAFGNGQARPFTTAIQPQAGITPFTESAARTPRFPRLEIPGLEPRPDFWKVRPEEIIQLCRNVKRGKAEIIARTPLGYPVYALFYGDFQEAPPQTNWSAGNSSSTWRSYMGGTPTDKQTFLFLAGVHGAEPECVAAAVNLIQALETGTDFRGRRHDELVDLISKYRFIIVPCLNMDGRAVSPDHLRQVPYSTFRAASQGRWANGKPIEWRESKEFFPLPLARVAHPGGYPNAEGYNIMHDAAPGDVRTAEARGLLKLIARWRVDAMLNGHSCETAAYLIPPGVINPPANIARGLALTTRVNTALHEAGLNPNDPARGPAPKPAAGFNLNTLAMLSSGCLALTLEVTVSNEIPAREGAARQPKILYTFDQLMAPALVTLREYLKDGLEKPFIDRARWEK